MTAPNAVARTISRADFDYITGVLHEHTGISLAPGKEALVSSRLDKRVRALGLAGFSDYVRLLRDHRDERELRQLVDLLTTNETFFFREPRHFEYLRREVLPKRAAGRTFRLWSAASSTGEEAYTAAMVLADTLPGGTWEIVGTDISTRVVEGARTGLYPIAAAEKIPRQMLRRFCLKGRDEYEGLMTVNRELRSKVRFHCRNLIQDFSGLGRFDVIMLRNVMIYFDVETKKSLIPRLQDMLVPGGHLIIGSSESLNAIPSKLRMVEPSIYRLDGDGRA
ncbi:chemotaxis protein methyltransferase CheR [Actinoplanes lutulentus]|uniref:protein-glutamate O-methyltransferase n=1 Tax=Actinoplanes lutulentus TaxID=1287878 RepID=A0A327Z5L6_9ACTN|nr:protein-glutamate O-methyltransferase CheR [Actinoplanes lutulentus]MBB2946956.1 chemotaxis protein methyltransferase CheR [Actinoplanes lutulentus]RAK30458.1 chemotaxis protein methyltransferase CheR [Actinoplanes lutulentus]